MPHEISCLFGAPDEIDLFANPRGAFIAGIQCLAAEVDVQHPAA
jgi:hypothetical protein